ncbi:MAG: hypothetical protein GWQ05_10860, partial [Verrucomicrobiaceae bacterium]|nr:hypothetical protein [Verrucomicrobiaceae bacterium]
MASTVAEATPAERFESVKKALIKPGDVQAKKGGQETDARAVSYEHTVIRTPPVSPVSDDDRDKAIPGKRKPGGSSASSARYVYDRSAMSIRPVRAGWDEEGSSGAGTPRENLEQRESWGPMAPVVPRMDRVLQIPSNSASSILSPPQPAVLVRRSEVETKAAAKELDGPPSLSDITPPRRDDASDGSGADREEDLDEVAELQLEINEVDQRLDNEEVYVKVSNGWDRGDLLEHAMGDRADYEERYARIAKQFVSQCLHEKRRRRDRHRAEGLYRAPDKCDFHPYEVDELIFEAAGNRLMDEIREMVIEYFITPFKGRSDPRAYQRGYLETCSKIANDVPAIPANEKNLEALTLILNMALRSVNVLSQVHAIRQVEALSGFERDKVIQCARFVVEHVMMFPEDILLRAEKFAMAVKFADEKDDWKPEAGRHYADASEIFIWDSNDGPPVPHVRYGKAGNRQAKQGFKPGRGVLVALPSTVTFAPKPHSNLVGSTGKDAWVFGGPEKYRSFTKEYTPEQFHTIYKLLVVHLRHDPLAVMNSACTCDAATFFERFREEYPEESGWTETDNIREMFHIMVWGGESKKANRTFVFWEDPDDIAVLGKQSQHRHPLRISVASGHSFDHVPENVCETFLYERDHPDWPLQIIHHTKFESLVGILRDKQLYPGGTKKAHESSGKKRPIFAEGWGDHRDGQGGCAHRPNCTAAVYVKPDALKDECERSRNKVGICRNGAVVISKPVPLSAFLRVEAYSQGEANNLTLWQHPGGILTYFRCPACRDRNHDTWLPRGTDICWKADCQKPLTDKGVAEFVRMYRVSGDQEKMREVFRGNPNAEHTRNLDKTMRRMQERADSVPDPKKKNSVGYKDRPAMLRHYALHAKKKDHTGIRDPKNPDVWLVAPKSRKFHDHSERYKYDEVYARQCHENEAVDKDGKLTHRHRAEDGSVYIVDYEEQEAKRVAALDKDRQAKGKGKGTGKGKQKPVQQPQHNTWNQHQVTWG